MRQKSPFTSPIRCVLQYTFVIMLLLTVPHKASLHGPGGHVQWGNVKSKTRRERSTLALEPGVWEDLIEDVREFLDIEDWYTELGIPHHRGYLLHGPPGTGKSRLRYSHLTAFILIASLASTIYALAGELNLEIYSLSLASGQYVYSFKLIMHWI